MSVRQEKIQMNETKNFSYGNWPEIKFIRYKNNTENSLEKSQTKVQLL